MPPPANRSWRVNRIVSRPTACPSRMWVCKVSPIMAQRPGRKFECDRESLGTGLARKRGASPDRLRRSCAQMSGSMARPSFRGATRSGLRAMTARRWPMSSTTSRARSAADQRAADRNRIASARPRSGPEPERSNRVTSPGSSNPSPSVAMAPRRDGAEMGDGDIPARHDLVAPGGEAEAPVVRESRFAGVAGRVGKDAGVLAHAAQRVEPFGGPAMAVSPTFSTSRPSKRMPS